MYNPLCTVKLGARAVVILTRLFLLLFAAALVSACDQAPTGPPARMVNLATVQSGPQLQAQTLEGAIARQPQKASLYARRAIFRLEAGQIGPALTDINQALGLDDAPGEFHFIKARALRAQNRLDATLTAATEASIRGFSSPELNLLVGETHLASRHYQDAVDHLDRALREEPELVAALFYKGLAHAALTDTAQALDYLRASLARDPRQPEILHQLAFLSNANRRPAAAAVYATRGLRLAPTSGALWYDYGRQHELQNRPDSAISAYNRAVVLDSTLYRADYRLGLAAFKQRRYADAVPHLQRALRRASRLPAARQMVAESFEALGRPADAIVQYRLLAAENPSNKHWTYRIWKAGERSRQLRGDTMRRPVRQAIAPLLERPLPTL